MKNNFGGLFIVLEGLDMSGKSTLARNLQKYIIEELGYSEKDVLLTREPGNLINTGLCEDIRNIIIDNNMCAKTEALLFAASRIEHTTNTIIPNLRKGKIVISDRYIASSIVYQGIFKKLGIDYILNINKGYIKPDVTLITNCDIKIAIDRAKQNNKNDMNRFDEELNNKMAQKEFLKLADVHDNYHIIDTSGSKSESLKYAAFYIEEYLK